MNKLLIVGAGGHGKCCLDIARDMKQFQRIDFLDDNRVGEVINECKVIGTIGDISTYYPEYTNIFIAVGNNKLREELSIKAKNIGYTLVSLISSDAYISRYAVIGNGSVIFPKAVVEANAKIGKECILGSSTVINHDASIEDYVLINTGSIIRPEVSIGSLTSIGCNCVISFGSQVEMKSIIDDYSHIK